MYILYIYIRIWRSESIITGSIVVRSPTYECAYECTECDNWHGRHHPKIVLFSAIARLSVWLTDSLYLAFLLTRSDWKATEMKRSFGQPALRLSVCPSFGLYAIDSVCLESCSGGQRNTCAPLYSVCDTLIKTHCGFEGFSSTWTSGTSQLENEQLTSMDALSDVFFSMFWLDVIL